MTTRTGRPLHAIWSLFDKVERPGMHPNATCKYCSLNIVSAKCYQLKKHVKDCKYIPEIDSCKFTQTPTVRKSNRYAKDNENEADEHYSASKMYSQNDLEYYFALMFYSTGMSFRLVEDPFLRMFFSIVCPNFKIPTRKKLSGSLLDISYAACKKQVITSLSEKKSFSLVSDGWADARNNHIVNFVLASPNMELPIFWSSIDTSAHSNDGAFVADYLKKAMSEVENATTTKNQICSIVTDNALVMKKGVNLLLKDKPELLWVGCSAHWMNLLIGQVIELPEIKEILLKCTKITSYIKNSYTLLSLFRSEQMRQKRKR